MLCTFNTLGTPSNTAIHKYMNQKKVPQLYVATGASKWGNPKDFPWTMGYQPDYHTEAVIYAKHILANVKDAKIGVLMQNDDYGKDYLDGFKEGLGKDAGRDRQARHLRGRPIRRSTRRSSSSRTPAPTSSSTSRRRSSPPRRSARRPTSAGSRRSTSTTSRRAVGIGDEAGRLRQRAGHHHRGLPHGSDRPTVGRRRRHEDVARRGWPSTCRRRQPGRRQQRLRLRRVVPDGTRR